MACRQVGTGRTGIHEGGSVLLPSTRSTGDLGPLEQLPAAFLFSTCAYTTFLDSRLLAQFLGLSVGGLASA